jgi:phosphatidylglycerophosphate synthase
MLVALIAALFGEPPLPAVAAAAGMTSLLATALDGVDGWLARRQRIASEFGARFDMEIDALLILVLAVLVAQFEKAGVWVVLSGLLRYLFVGAGSHWPWLQAPLMPSRRRQTICVIQILALTFAILPPVAPPLSTMLAAAALGSLAYSFLVDTVWLWRHAQ